tara:strand:- start:73 stop:474 length:402 start_codon:yes stop_codon:yes gene_type:complete
MRGLLELLLKNQGTHDIVIESAGVGESSKQHKPAPTPSQVLAPTYGIDLSSHRTRHVGEVDLSSFDLFIAADKHVQTELRELGVIGEIICLELEGAANAWQAENPAKVERMIHTIYQALLREVISYKFRVHAQ